MTVPLKLRPQTQEYSLILSLIMVCPGKDYALTLHHDILVRPKGRQNDKLVKVYRVKTILFALLRTIFWFSWLGKFGNRYDKTIGLYVKS